MTLVSTQRGFLVGLKSLRPGIETGEPVWTIQIHPSQSAIAARRSSPSWAAAERVTRRVSPAARTGTAKTVAANRPFRRLERPGQRHGPPAGSRDRPENHRRADEIALHHRPRNDGRPSGNPKT